MTTNTSTWPEKPHVSTTSLRAFDVCPRSWALRYALDRLAVPDELAAAIRTEARLAPGSPPALVGAVVDQTVKDAMRLWAEGGVRPAGLLRPAMDVLRGILAYSAAWSQAVRDGARPPESRFQPLDRVWFGEPWSQGEKDEVVDAVRVCLRHFEQGEFLDLCDEAGPARWLMPPEGPPPWFHWPVDDGGPAVPCWAAFDFIVFQPDGRVLVYDFKTGDPANGSSVTEQLAIYGAYCVHSLGVPREEVRLIPFWLRSGEEDVRRLSPLVLGAVREKVRQRHRLLLACLQTAKEGMGFEAFPMAEDPRACRSCPFRSCPGHGRADTTFAPTMGRTRRIPCTVLRRV